MSETTESVKLDVPDSAAREVRALITMAREPGSFGEVAWARAISTPVVAAELRDLLERAAALDLKTIDGLWGLVSKRADELEAQS